MQHRGSVGWPVAHGWVTVESGWCLRTEETKVEGDKSSKSFLMKSKLIEHDISCNTYTTLTMHLISVVIVGVCSTYASLTNRR